MCFHHDERAECYRENTRKARKPHECQGCGRTIQPGEYYTHTGGGASMNKQDTQKAVRMTHEWICDGGQRPTNAQITAAISDAVSAWLTRRSIHDWGLANGWRDYIDAILAKVESSE